MIKIMTKSKLNKLLKEAENKGATHGTIEGYKGALSKIADMLKNGAQVVTGGLTIKGHGSKVENSIFIITSEEEPAIQVKKESANVLIKNNEIVNCESLE